MTNHSHNHQRADVKKSQGPALNTGLADALAGLSFEPLTSAPRRAPDRQTGPQQKPQARRHPRGESRPESRADDSAQLPSHFLRRREGLPEWENTGNFIFVKVSGTEYAYPIHSWVPVMDLCEAIYLHTDRGRRASHKEHRQLIRFESRVAITELVQGYCNRGPFNLIPRSVVERVIRKRLALMFPAPPRDKLHPSSQPHQKAVDSFSRPALVWDQASYMERIHAYRTSNPHDGATAPQPVRDRLDQYIAMKARRVGDNPAYSLDNAFTCKSNAESRTVWVGLDFGTQNMKAAFRDAESDDQSVILELNPAARGIDRYMIAPATVVEGDRLIHLRDGSGAAVPSWKHALSLFYGESYTSEDRALHVWLDRSREQCAELKNRSHEELVHFFATIHVAFMLETVGELIRAYYRERGIDDPLAFRAFMCAPVATLDQQLSQSIFQDCLTIADEMHALLDFSGATVNVHDALEAYEQARRLRILLEPRPCRRARVVPEVLAEIASFAQSKSAQEGFYALVDIGAGTLDLNVFKVLGSTQDSGVRTPVYAASCHPNGVDHLEYVLRQAIDGVGEIEPAHIEDQKRRRCFPDIQGLAKACCVQDEPSLIHRMTSAHMNYCDDIASRTRLTWGEAWQKRGLERTDWASLTLFLCGGGASIRDIQERLEAGMPQQIIQRIKHSVLPCPSEAECVLPAGFPEQDFHRVAVAYGLTFGSDFEPFMLPSQIHQVQVHRETFDVESHLISKDMV